jgi:hypothetical protein
VNGYTEHLYTRLEITSNYNAPANLHTLQFTVANIKPSQACSVFTNRSLAKASNSGDFSSSRAHVVTVRQISRNSQLYSTQLSIAPLIIPRHELHRKHPVSIVTDQLLHIKTLQPSNGNVFTEPLPRNALVYPPISRSLHNNSYKR